MSDTKPGLGTDTVADAATSETVAASAPVATGGARLPAGAQIGRFVVLGTLGAGGMGVVYSAYDPQLDRKVAIKVLGAEAGTEEAQTRLLREAQAMAKIRHPNVIVVHEVGALGERVYVAMEFADGGTLRAWLAERTRSQREILDAFVQAGRGLVAAHAAGLVHRDFKPDNVLLSSDGTVRVTDFGLVGTAGAKTAAPEGDERPVDTGPTPLQADLTQTGAVMGTPRYMAPEQFRGDATTDRTDQFAFCVALYEALYGERPFAGTSYAELCANVTTGTLQPPRGGRTARVPARIRRVLLRGLSLDPAARHPSMKALLSALVPEPARRRALLLVGAGVVCAAGAATVIAMRGHAAGCGDGADHVRAVWNPGRRAALTSAFAATHRPLAGEIALRSGAAIDTWMAQWQAGYVGACEATRVRHEQSDRLLDLRMECLTQRLDDARATIDVAAGGGSDAVDHAIDAFAALPVLAPCADREGLLATVAPPPPAARAAVTSVDAQLAVARGSERLARYASATEVATRALDLARSTAYAPAISRALLQVGRTQLYAREPALSVPTLRDAMQTAARAGDLVTMLDAAGVLVTAFADSGKDYERAEEVGAVAAALAEHAHPPLDIAARLELAIGAIDMSRNRTDAAAARDQQLLARLDKELGPDHPLTLEAVSQLGEIDLRRARLDDARQRFERVLDTTKRIDGASHPDVAKALRRVAGVYRRQGKFDDARRVLEQALAIDRAATGPDSAGAAESLSMLGNIASDLEDYKGALDKYLEARTIFTKVYGDHSESAEGTSQRIGGVLESLGRHAEARTELEHALALSEQLHGTDNPTELDIYNNLALVSMDTGKYVDATEAFQHARRIAVAVGGEDTADIVDVDINIANVMKRQNRLAEAIAYQRRTLAIAAKVYGADHPNVGMLLANIAQNEDALKRPAESLADFQRALPIFTAKFGDDHQLTAQILAQIAQELDLLARRTDAVPFYERAIAIFTKAGADPKLISELQKQLAFDQKSHR